MRRLHAFWGQELPWPGIAGTKDRAWRLQLAALQKWTALSAHTGFGARIFIGNEHLLYVIVCAHAYGVLHFRVHFQYRIMQAMTNCTLSYPVMYPMHAEIQIHCAALWNIRIVWLSQGRLCRWSSMPKAWSGHQRFLPTLPRLSEERLQRNRFLTYLKSDIWCRQVVQLNQHHVL